MFRRIQAWWQNRREWSQNWAKNWTGYTEPYENGLSKLQLMVLEVISQHTEAHLERIQYEGLIGLEGVLPGTEQMLCIYNDTVTLTKGRSPDRYHLWEFSGYLTPQDFISDFEKDFTKCLSA